MVRPWLRGVKRRSIEVDYRYYDPPKVVWNKITQKTWEYKTRVNHYHLRDKALMCLLYLTTCRVSEIVRGLVEVGEKGAKIMCKLGSITKDQFNFEEDFIKVRDVRIVKRDVMTVEDYPKRREIALPRVGDLAIFTETIEQYLNTLNPEEELFKFGPCRAWQIVNHVTGEMNHYLRDMGLKLYSRIVDRNIKDLQDFSGHERLENLIKYLGEGNLENRLLKYKI